LLKQRHRHTLHTCKATTQKLFLKNKNKKIKKIKTNKQTNKQTTTTTKFRTENKKKIGEIF
jgi:hypothetical protein